MTKNLWPTPEVRWRTGGRRPPSSAGNASNFHLNQICRASFQWELKNESHCLKLTPSAAKQVGSISICPSLA